MSQLELALTEYQKRQARQAHPAGRFDRGGRWYPADSEECDCCSHIRTPSRAWPFSYMTHCRTLKHVAHLFNVSESDLRKLARATAN